jgi:UDP-N-acetyl-D-glucosamine dehydrogenase
MPYHVVERIGRGLSRRGKALLGARILVLGVAFKSDVDDARNSPAERIIELLLAQGAEVSYHDPHVPNFVVGGDVFLTEKRMLASVPLTEPVLAESDCVVIVTGHHQLDYDWVVRHAPLVVDSCNATSDVQGQHSTVLRLGAPA